MLVSLVAPLFPTPSGLWGVAVGVIAFACVSAEVLTASALTPRLSAKGLWVAVGAVGALALLATFAASLPIALAAALVTLSLLALGTSAGGVVGHAIDRPGHLLVVAIVSAAVDALSVLHPSGPTAQIIESDAAVGVLILPWPILGTRNIDPVLGVGDVAFAAIYLSAARRHGLSIRRTLIALSLALAGTLVAVFVTGRGIPALPFFGAAMLAAHPEARRLPEEDRAKALVGLLALGALVGALLYFS
ncbi:MAG: hypothetical protein RLO52_45480 [Sandaracinaceae bacterium]